MLEKGYQPVWLELHKMLEKGVPTCLAGVIQNAGEGVPTCLTQNVCLANRLDNMWRLCVWGGARQFSCSLITYRMEGREQLPIISCGIRI